MLLHTRTPIHQKSENIFLMSSYVITDYERSPSVIEIQSSLQTFGSLLWPLCAWSVQWRQHTALADGQTERQIWFWKMRYAAWWRTSMTTGQHNSELSSLLMQTLVSKSAELSPLEIVIAWQVSNTISGRFSGAGKKHPVAEYARYFPDKGQMIIKLVQINLAKAQENKRTTTTRRAVMWHLMLETWSTRHVKLRHHKMGHGTTKSTL